MEILKIIALTIGAAVVYGVLHDQVTARVCVEYFTVAHPPVFGGLTSPTLLAFAWGVIATWWAGAYVGVPLAIASRLGAWPKVAARDLARPLAGLFVAMAISAFAYGIVGWRRALADTQLRASVGEFVLPDHAAAFVAVWFAHSASYSVGFIGGVVLWLYIVITRWRRGARAGPSNDEIQRTRRAQASEPRR
jgi:hypothetical protein